MPRMPEIVGETQDAVPGPEQTGLKDRVQERTPPVVLRRGVRITSGIIASPLTLRLFDFSGEGERAPPGFMRWAASGGCRDSAAARKPRGLANSGRKR